MKKITLQSGGMALPSTAPDRGADTPTVTLPPRGNVMEFNTPNRAELEGNFMPQGENNHRLEFITPGVEPSGIQSGPEEFNTPECN